VAVISLSCATSVGQLSRSSGELVNQHAADLFKWICLKSISGSAFSSFSF